jgi:hypothetical protein
MGRVHPLHQDGEVQVAGPSADTGDLHIYPLT